MTQLNVPVSGESGKKGWKKLLSLAVKYLLPLLLTVALVWYMFEKVSFSDMIGILRGGVRYEWILLAMAISVFSHIFRAMRWGLQLRGLGINAPMMALCCSIFGTYALNLVFPRLGEVWRCAYISGREKAPFSTVLGSMVADRLADTITVLLLTLAAFVIAHSAMASFLAKYPVGEDLLRLMADPLFWAAIAAACAAVFCVAHFGRNIGAVRKAKGLLREIWQGFIVVVKMKGRGRFLLLTLCIWTCYFMQLYVAFYAFPFTAQLCGEPSLAWGLTPALVAFVLSSIGMAIPSNGGLGPWNIAVMFGLAIYGITDAQGTAFSMLVWSAQTVMLILLGIFTMIYISASRPHKDAVAGGKASPDQNK